MRFRNLETPALPPKDRSPRIPAERAIPENLCISALNASFHFRYWNVRHCVFLRITLLLTEV